MTEDKAFTLKWLSLMTACVRRGTKIKIIHSIDRNLDEMIAAIRNWMPLYMSGMVESYYCVGQSNSPITYTLFLSPGTECVYSVCVRGHEADAAYFYETNQDGDSVKKS